MKRLTRGSDDMGIEQDKRHAFDAYCKRIVKNEAVNVHLEYDRQGKWETVFSELDPQEKQSLQYIDRYTPDRQIFTVLNMDVEVVNGDLVRALTALPPERRNIVLLAYLLDMRDDEIAGQLQLNRSTVQYRRTSTLKELRKLMEEYENE